MARRLFIAMLILLNTKMFSQDLQLTQFYAMPMYLNPAFTGANVCSRVSLTYRNQWPGIGNGYVTKMLAFDHTLGNSSWGIGALVARDEAGAAALRSTMVQPAISYEARINRVSLLRFGLQPGIGIRSVNMGSLLFGDQIYRGGSGIATVESAPQTKLYFDLGAGALYSYRIFWAGISAFHLNLPNESFYASPYGRLPLKLSLHTGAKFDLSSLERETDRKTYFSPVIHYRAQERFDQLDIGFYFSRSILNAGIWYRGIPGLKSYAPGYSNHDAVAFIIGVQTEKIKLGYSYDHTISELAGITNGAHEINLSFQLCKAKKPKRKLRVISCPKF